MKNKIVGIGFFLIGMMWILVALSILFAEHSYFSALKRSSWIAMMLKVVYGEFANFMEAWLMLCLGLAFVYRDLYGMRTKSERESLSVKRGLILSRLRNRVSRRNRLKKSNEA